MDVRTKNHGRNFKLRFLFLTMFFLCFSPGSAAVQAEVTFDGSLGGPTGSMSGPTYEITSDWGTLSGDNLFHSFGQFNILTDQMATFSGPSNVTNIIGRVTGGASSIDGTICSTIEGANLYLLNPFGIMFGPNATLDLTGSFHVSTGDFIRFADGEVFYTDPARESVLAITHPSAFGFLDYSPSPVSIQGSMLQVPDGQTLSIIGGDITLSGPALEESPTLGAHGGRVDVVSVASPGEVVPNLAGELQGIDVSSFSSLGSISIVNGADIVADGNGGGTIFIRGGRLVMEMSDPEDASVICAHNIGDEDAANQVIDIQIDGELLLTGGLVEASGYGMGRAADIRIGAGDMIIGDIFASGEPFATGIGSRAWDAGDGGNIEVTADNLTVTNWGSISTFTQGEGDGGNITLDIRGDLKILDNGLIYTNGDNYWLIDPGDTGDLSITAGNILLAGSGDTTGLFCQASGGNSGDFFISTGDLRIEGAAEISNSTFSFGEGGLLNIEADSIHISGSPFYSTGIFSNTWGSGQGGDLNISSGFVELDSRASIESGTIDGGWAGSGTGNAGNLSIETETLVLRNGSFITAGGLMGAGGDSGHVSIVATDILIEGFESSPNPFSSDATGIFNSNIDGKCGDISIDTETLTLNQRGTVSTQSMCAGVGGDIFIDFIGMEVLDGSTIAAGTSGSGAGGSIELAGGHLMLSGVNDQPFTDITGKTNLASSSISSQATGALGGEAGDLTIHVDKIEILDGAQLTTTTFGPGNGGNIEVTAEEILLSGRNADLAAFHGETGEDTPIGGSAIYTNTDCSRLGDLAIGDAGDISLSAKNIVIEDGAVLYTGSNTSGKGGDINMTAGESVTLSDGWILSTASGTGDAGNISINAGENLISKGGLVSTEAIQSSGGSIAIHVNDLMYLLDAEVTTSVQQGDANAGNITIDPEFVVLNNSRIVANAYGGAGGNILIVADVFLADPFSVVDASSTLGIDGEVDIQAPYRYISEGMVPLSEDFTDPITLLRESCMARATGGRYSSLVVAGPDGFPLLPGHLLPSPLPYRIGNVDFDRNREKSFPSSTRVMDPFPENGAMPGEMDHGGVGGCPLCSMGGK